MLDVLDGQPVEYLPLRAPNRPAPTPGSSRPRGSAAAAPGRGADPGDARAGRESVVVPPDGSDLRLMLDGGTEVRFGAAEDLVDKLVRLQTVLDDHGDEPISVIDVSTNEVTVR